MSDVIRLLPDSVANQIAAGEVIQRPASVIKELVENAVDAGATDISIIVKDAGKTVIQVIDNGCGMSETDARMAFERHATSKIRGAEDLFSLTTMGFRGEALPSICAISEVEIKTRTCDAPMGTRLVIEGSKVISQEPCMCDVGTVFTVKRLFYNVPARRKFLKSDSVELSNIMREFERLALVNNGIRIRMDNGTRQLDLRAGTMLQRIGELWKNNLNMQLLPVEVDTDLVRIKGYVSRPEFARRRNPLQFLFVNGRNMRHPYFHKGIMSCFDSLIAADTQPCYFIKFEVGPDTIDVNIHPTKNEIKFEYENEIWQILTAAVRAALGKFSAVPSIDFTMDALPVKPLAPGELPSKPEIEMGGGYNPFDNGYNSDRVSVKNWESLYESFKREGQGNTGFSGQGNESHNSESGFRRFSSKDSIEPDDSRYAPEPESTPDADSLFGSNSDSYVAPLCMQYAGRYIVTPSRDGLLIIDQHRAHIKILYERYMRQASKTSIAAQGVMFPESIRLDETQRAALEEINDDLVRMGFSLEYDCEDKWNITTVPSISGLGEASDIIMRVLDSVTEDSSNYGSESAQGVSVAGRIALVMARASAIRRGTVLSSQEMEYLLGELFALPDPATTPNGNPIFCLLDETRIDSFFR